ncbi:hypothetical protein GMO_14060 [Gluconobacter morbifer G707]|uniref:Uncharacterized protein n=1 Tax=Gluconobacter morbifer G707 TaxID=1088869 RepID=G6XIJ6_9PROT|nr:hypothetical protein GMO_14060 [Gluconobacter morbifer G707]
MAAGLLGLVFLCMPFAVFGLKPRMLEMEYQLAELRAEIQSISLRLATPPSERLVTSAAPPEEQGVDRSSSDGRHGKAERPAPEISPEAYLDPVHVIRPDMPSYEDGPMAKDAEALPRAARRDAMPAGERRWSQAPWEGRQVEPAADRRDAAPHRVKTPYRDDDTLMRPRRSEPQLRWPPRG